MPYRKLDLGESVNETLSDGEVSHHNHYGSDGIHALTLLPDPDQDTDYEGEPFVCELCGTEVDYYVCDECGEEFGKEEQLNGHMSSHSGEEDG